MEEFEITTSSVQKDMTNDSTNLNTAAASDTMHFDDFECLGDHVDKTNDQQLFDPTTLSINNPIPVSGLVSTTRPLLTTGSISIEDEENLLLSDFGCDKPKALDKPSPNDYDKLSGSIKKQSLIDVDFGNEPLLTTTQHHENLSIESIEASPSDDSRKPTSGASPLTDGDTEHWGAALDEKKQTVEGEEKVESFNITPAAVPKIENPVSDVSGFRTSTSSSSASKDIAHPPTAAEKNPPAMEGDHATESSAECCFSPAVWFNPDKLNPTVAEYVYWRNVKKSSIAFGTILFLLLSLKFFSFISVAAYVTLTVLLITITFRIYKNVLQAVQKSNEGHPFKDYLEMDISLSHDKLRDMSEGLIHHVNAVVHKLRSLVLVEDLVDTIKLVVFAYCLTYIGAWFNGMTVIILAFVSAFTLPKVYEANKAQIDTYADIIITKGKEVMQMVNSKIPLGKKKKDE